jgi:hypothetical protein
MTAWGTAPARGWIRFCAACGAALVFVEAGLSGKTKKAKRRYDAAIGAHTESSFRCHEATTFLGGEITACRCERPMLIERENGLMCARCEGLVAPVVAATRPGRSRAAK